MKPERHSPYAEHRPDARLTRLPVWPSDGGLSTASTAMSAIPFRMPRRRSRSLPTPS